MLKNIAPLFILILLFVHTSVAQRLDPFESTVMLYNHPVPYTTVRGYYACDTASAIAHDTITLYFTLYDSVEEIGIRALSAFPQLHHPQGFDMVDSNYFEVTKDYQGSLHFAPAFAIYYLGNDVGHSYAKPLQLYKSLLDSNNTQAEHTMRLRVKRKSRTMKYKPGTYKVIVYTMQRTKLIGKYLVQIGILEKQKALRLSPVQHADQ